jgi:AraC-like DNA-binding protein
MGESHLDLRETQQIGAGSQERTVGPEQCPGLGEAGIRLCGLSLAQPGFRFVRRRPQVAQILACLGGRGRVLCGGRWQDCVAGQVYLTPAGPLHAYQAEADWELVWAFGDFTLPQAAPELVACDPAPLASLVDGLHREAWGPRDGRALACWAQLLALALPRIAGGSAGDDQLEGLWLTVSADLAASWSCAGLARRLACSEEHLRRRCLRRYGESPMRRLCALRMQQAGNLLRATSLSMAAIAAAVGYENPFAFSTAFRRWSGRSPSAFRADSSGG